MESLYRKYRPLTFDSVVGQQHIVSTLEHAVAEGRLSHAYLFCGPRGTGKTTMARILAKSLLCQGAEAARATGASGCMPDGTCPECEAIAAGTHPDVYELDAASRTGVDNVREEIIGSVNFAPVRGAYKVYIIDEVHMLTAAAFNALLKTLEEPPSHVVFILCTTDPQKILETILSRCQRFDFHRISNDDIVKRLRFICEQEGFAFDEAALEIVARHARGGMRDALSTLEQLSVFGDGSVRVDDARALLGEVASAVLSEFACKIAVRDTVGLFGLVHDQLEAGNDLLELTRDLVAHMRDVYTAAIAGPRVELFDGTPEEVAALVEEAALFEGADRLARTLTVLDDAVLEMRDASDPRLVLEIAFTRLARPETDLTLESLAERILHLETQLSAGIPRGPMTAEQRAAMVSSRTATVAASAPRATVPMAPAAASVAAKSVPASVAPVIPASPAEPQPTKSQVSSATASQPTPTPASAASQTVSAEPQRASVTSQAAPASQLTTPTPQPIPVPQPAMPTPQPTPAPQPAMPSVPSTSQPAPVSAAAQPSTSAPVTTQPASASNMPQPAVSTPVISQPAAAPTPVPAQSAVSKTVSAESQSTMAACAVTPPAADAGDLQRRWLEVVKLVTAAQASRGALLQSSRAVSDDGETLTVAFPKGSNFALKMITRADSRELVMPIVCQVFGKRSVVYEMDGAAGGGAPAVAPSAAPAPVPVSVSEPAPAPLVSEKASQDRENLQDFPKTRAYATETNAAPTAPAPTPVPAPESTPASVSAPAPASEPPIPEPAWDDDMPPYDDEYAVLYEDDLETSPFDVPSHPASSAPAPAQSAPVQPSNQGGSAVVEEQSKVASPAASAMPSFGSQGPAIDEATDAPTLADKEAMLKEIFGTVTIIE